ncbi:hypothetical protein Hamer_G001285 [Homarus americanus]|uniref:Uncharacterized protein n=1 Tax=Homarus americanus TaxID=6706 RepID=A0A8J5N7L7_HOMAM|nr:hypothetical protein Hamer_G001285 [Homarus americanus]
MCHSAGTVGDLGQARSQRVWQMMGGCRVGGSGGGCRVGGSGGGEGRWQLRSCVGMWLCGCRCVGAGMWLHGCRCVCGCVVVCGCGCVGVVDCIGVWVYGCKCVWCVGVGVWVCGCICTDLWVSECRCLSTGYRCLSVRVSEYRCLSRDFWVQISEYRYLSTGYRFMGTGVGCPGAGINVWVFEYSCLGTGVWIPVSEYRCLDRSVWVPGCKCLCVWDPVSRMVQKLLTKFADEVVVMVRKTLLDIIILRLCCACVWMFWYRLQMYRYLGVLVLWVTRCIGLRVSGFRFQGTGGIEEAVCSTKTIRRGLSQGMSFWG